MAANNSASFLFSTNIQEVVGEITAGLRALQKDANQLSGSRDPMFAGLPRDLQAIFKDARVEVRNFNRDLVSGLSNVDVSTAYGNIFKKVEAQVGRELANRGFTVDVALNIATPHLEKFAESLQAEQSAFASKKNLTPAQVGTAPIVSSTVNDRAAQYRQQSAEAAQRRAERQQEIADQQAESRADALARQRVARANVRAQRAQENAARAGDPDVSSEFLDVGQSEAAARAARRRATMAELFPQGASGPLREGSQQAGTSGYYYDLVDTAETDRHGKVVQQIANWYKTAGVGIDRLDDSQATEIRKAERALGAQLAAFREKQLSPQLVAEQGNARRTSTGTDLDKVHDVGDLRFDTRGPQVEALQRTRLGFRNLVGEDLQGAMEVYRVFTGDQGAVTNRQLTAKQRQLYTERANAARVSEQVAGGQAVVTDLGANIQKVLVDGLIEYYKIIGEGWRRLDATARQVVDAEIRESKRAAPQVRRQNYNQLYSGDTSELQDLSRGRVIDPRGGQIRAFKVAKNEADELVGKDLADSIKDYESIGNAAKVQNLRQGNFETLFPQGFANGPGDDIRRLGGQFYERVINGVRKFYEVGDGVADEITASQVRKWQRIQDMLSSESGGSRGPTPAELRAQTERANHARVFSGENQDQILAAGPYVFDQRRGQENTYLRTGSGKLREAIGQDLDSAMLIYDAEIERIKNPPLIPKGSARAQEVQNRRNALRKLFDDEQAGIIDRYDVGSNVHKVVHGDYVGGDFQGTTSYVKQRGDQAHAATPQEILAAQTREGQESAAQLARQNMQAVFSGPGNTLGSASTRIGTSPYIRRTIDSVETIFKEVDGGLDDITHSAKEMRKYAVAQARADVAAVQQSETAGGADGGRAGGGAGGGLWDNFLKGFFSGGFGGGGSGGVGGLMRAAGTTVKYSALYDILGELEQAFAAAAAQVVDFQDNLNDLEVSMGRSIPNTNEFVSALEDVSAPSGANIGDAMATAGDGIRALGHDANLTTGQLEQLAVTFTSEANKMAVIAKTTLPDAAGNLRAISNAFDIPPRALSRINDAIAMAKQVGGGDEKETAQALASFGAAAQEAGFNLEQAAALASRVQASTDESGATVGNRLSRLTSIVSGSAGQSAIASVNAALPQDQQIDLNGSVYQQLLQLSKVYDTVIAKNPQLKKSLINALGGTAQGKELIVTLEDLSSIVDNNGKGLDSAGKAAEEYERRLRNLRVTLDKLKVDLENIITNLGMSGAFDPIVLAVQTLASFVGSISKLTQDFAKLNPLISKGTIYTLEFYAAMKAIQAISNEGGIKAAFAAMERRLAPTRAASRATLALQAQGGRVAGEAAPSVAGVGSGAVIPIAARSSSAIKAGLQAKGLVEGDAEVASVTRAGLLRKSGSTFLASADKLMGVVGTVAPYLLAAGLAFSAIKGKIDQMGDAVDAAKSAAFDLANASSAEDYRNAASELASKAEDVRQSGNGPLGNLLQGRAAQQEAAKYRQEARQASDAADRLDRVNASLKNVGVFGDPATRTVDGMTTTLQRLTDQGVGATERLKLLTDALRGIAAGPEKKNAAGVPVVPIENTRVTGELSGGLVGLQEGRPEFGKYAPRTRQATMPNGVALTPGPPVENPLHDILSANRDKIEQGIDASLKQIGPLPASQQGILTAGQRQKVIDSVIRVVGPQYADQVKKLGGDLFGGSSVEHFTGVLSTYLDDFLSKHSVTAQLAPGTVVSPADILKTITDEILPSLQNSLTVARPGDTGAVDNAYKVAIAAINDQLAHVPPGADVSGLLEQRDQLVRARADAAVADMETIRKADQAHAKTLADVRRIGDKSFNTEVLTELRAGNISAVIDIINRGNTAEVALVRSNLEGQKTTAKAALDAAKEQQRIIAAMSGTSAQNQGGPGALHGDAWAAATNQANAAVAAAQHGYDTTTGYLNTFNDAVTKSTPDTQGGGDYATGGSGVPPWQQELNKRLAHMNTDSTLGQAQAQLLQARTEFEHAKKTDSDYWQKWKAYKDAQKAIAEQAANLAALDRQLNTDMTNPLQQAQNELKTAWDKYKRDRANGAGADTLKQDRLDIYKDQASEESTAFSQRMTDIQHAEQMGTLSHRAYMEYLASERKRLQSRLAGMKTTDQGYQQAKDELFQVDDALKSAADSLNGMFNIGDIKIPTPYQVRRAIEQGSAGDVVASNSPRSTAGNVTHDSSTRSVILNGVPIQQVLTMIQDLFGIKARASQKRRVP